MKINSVIPHLGTFSVVPNNISNKVNLYLENDLMTTSNIFCKLTTESLQVSYSKLNYVSLGNSKQVTCEINKTISTNVVQFVDIEIFMDLPSNFSFILSANNQTYLLSPSLLTWKQSRIVNTNNLNVLLNFDIPERDFDYKLEMIPDIQNATNSTVSCLFFKGFNPTCNLSESYFDQLELLPLKLNFTYHISHTFTKVIQVLSVEYLIYYKSILIDSLKPFVVSSVEKKHFPMRIISSIRYHKFNHNFKYKCNSKFNIF
jgi:hypothetical protein